MVFWGVEVRPGEKLKLEPEFEKLICITKAEIGRPRKKPKVVRNMRDRRESKHVNVPLRLRVNGKNLIAGFLSTDQPHVKLNLVLEKSFRLFHDFKNHSVVFTGFIRPDPVQDKVLYYDFYGDLED